MVNTNDVQNFVTGVQGDQRQAQHCVDMRDIVERWICDSEYVSVHVPGYFQCIVL